MLLDKFHKICIDRLMSFIPPSVNYTYKKPIASSLLTRRIQTRQIYSSYIIQNQRLEQGCSGYNGLQNGLPADGRILPDLIEGARFTTPEERERILANAVCPVLVSADSPSPLPPTPPPPEASGSMAFSSSFGVSGSSIRYPNDASLAIGTQDFTIEWFQFWQTGASFPRVFSIGTFPSAVIGVSLEGGSFFLWINASARQVGTAPSINTWVHIAIVGNGTSIKVYFNGVLLGTETISYNLTNTTTALAIGNETNPSTNAGFTGQITNFRWVVGTQVYTGNFTVPSTPLTDILGTQLLLLAENETDVVKDSSSANRTPTNTGVEFDNNTPFS
jgi:hypothetical protein